MLPLLADESLNGEIVRQVRRKIHSADFMTARDAGLLHEPDPQVLEWAAANARIVVASDERTMIGHAYDRIEAGLPMPGLVVAGQHVGIGLVVKDLLYMIECSEPEEWKDQVTYLPL